MKKFKRFIHAFGNHPRRRWARLLYHRLTGTYLWGVIQFWIDWHIRYLPPGWKYRIWTRDTPSEPIYFSRPHSSGYHQLDEWLERAMRPMNEKD